jgi:hypothetical protein
VIVDVVFVECTRNALIELSCIAALIIIVDSLSNDDEFESTPTGSTGVKGGDLTAFDSLSDGFLGFGSRQAGICPKQAVQRSFPVLAADLSTIPQTLSRSDDCSPK